MGEPLAMGSCVDGPLRGTRVPLRNRAAIVHRPDGVEMWYAEVSEPLCENGFYYGRRRFFTFMGYFVRGVSLRAQAPHDTQAAALLLHIESGGFGPVPVREVENG
jgi:hypothetical protein